MLTVSELSAPSQFPVSTHTLGLESTLQELSLFDFQIESSCLGKDLMQLFNENVLAPGVILTEDGRFMGMISRRHFLEKMSRPYALELFSKRAINCLYPFINTKILVLPGDTLIVSAAKKSLQRAAKLLYDPIVVHLRDNVYRLLDVHQLLVSQSHIHELTANLLDEQTQAKMLQTEKMASLGRMVAGVAHEIKNPVNFLYGNFDFLSSHCQGLMEMISVYEAEMSNNSEKVAEVKEDLDIDFILEDLPKIINSMKIGAEQLRKIIGSLQNFSHMDEVNLQQINLHDCIEGTLLILNSRIKQGIEVVKNYDNLPMVSCYSGQMSQVFMNILSNAIDALTEKATEQPYKVNNWKPQINITTEFLKSDNSHISVRIADNGAGIPPEIKERIFETFFTTKSVGKGTGLGLAISNQIVTQKHQGKLLVNSQPKVGTEFQILLPLS